MLAIVIVHLVAWEIYLQNQVVDDSCVQNAEQLYESAKSVDIKVRDFPATTVFNSWLSPFVRLDPRQ